VSERADFIAGGFDTHSRHFVVVRTLKDDTIQIRAHLPDGGVDPTSIEVFSKEDAAKLATILEGVNANGPEEEVWYIGGAFFRPSEVRKLAKFVRAAIAYEP
jgi:hypothetical protein